MTLKQILCGLSGHLWRPKADDERLFLQCFVCDRQSSKKPKVKAVGTVLAMVKR